MTRDTDTADDPCCKVARVAAAYGLEDLDASLETRRVEGDASLRDLADYVNARLTGAAMARADADVVGDARSVYEALSGEADTVRRATVEDGLRFSGVDLDGLRADFVSHETVRGHVRDHLGIDTARDGVDDVEDARAAIAAIRERDRTIVRRMLDRLAREGVVSGGSLEVTGTVRVTCADCGASATVDAFLDDGGCDCDPNGRDA